MAEQKTSLDEALRIIRGRLNKAFSEAWRDSEIQTRVAVAAVPPPEKNSLLLDHWGTLADEAGRMAGDAFRQFLPFSKATQAADGANWAEQQVLEVLVLYLGDPPPHYQTADAYFDGWYEDGGRAFADVIQWTIYVTDGRHFDLNENLPEWRAPVWLGDGPAEGSGDARLDEADTGYELAFLHFLMWATIGDALRRAKEDALIEEGTLQARTTRAPAEVPGFELLKPDFTHVRVNGREFKLNLRQATIVQILHDEIKAGGSGELREKDIMEKLRTPNSRLRDAFQKMKPDWKKLIAQPRRGFYRLNLPAQSKT